MFGHVADERHEDDAEKEFGDAQARDDRLRHVDERFAQPGDAQRG